MEEWRQKMGGMEGHGGSPGSSEKAVRGSESLGEKRTDSGVTYHFRILFLRLNHQLIVAKTVKCDNQGRDALTSHIFVH
jgi:hypothetical protein